MDRIASFLARGVSFGRNCVGLVTRPYETVRRIAQKPDVVELLYIGILLSVYFAVASVVKATAFRPFLLTKQFALLTGGALIGYVSAVILFYVLGRLVGGAGSMRSMAVSWGYTLVPTVIWFVATSILYVVIPPPRTTSVAGVSFSVLFLLFSTVLLWWKVTLVYLALRFGMRLDLVRIASVAVASAPILSAWSYTMYRFGIFKVPFL